VLKPAALQKLTRYFKLNVKGDGLGEVDLDVLLWVVDVNIGAEGYRAGADIAIAGEFDAFFCAFDSDWMDTKRLVSLAFGDGLDSEMDIPDSDNAIRSLQSLWNSALGILIVAAYCVSGMPKCS